MNLSRTEVKVLDLEQLAAHPAYSAEVEGVSAVEKYQVVHNQLVALETRRNHNCSDALFRDLGVGEPVLKGVTFGSDMRLLVREAATPTVLFGPGDIRRAHAPDESVPVEELETTARSLALTALRFCGYEDDQTN